MELVLKDIGRRFGREWIFRHLDATIPAGSHLLIVGHNGSGKSTLLQIIAGFLTPSEGEVHRRDQDEHTNEAFPVAAPYMEVFEELTLKEAIEFHKRFRKFKNNLSCDEVMKILELTPHAGKQVRNFSSGMRQRLRLGLAILTEAPVICLDEPTSNLDRGAVKWYRQLLQEYAGERTVIVSSNHQEDDYLKADMTIDVATHRG